MRGRRLALVLFGALATGAIDVAARQPVFRSGVEYVRVDVVVTDRSDRPVADLRRDEFQITENDRPQTISDFRFVSVPLEHRTINADAVEPEPDVSTNTAPSPDSRLFAIVVDDLHLIESDIVPLKRVLMDFIAALSPDDDVAIVFVGHSNLSVNFTRNATRLRTAIDHVRNAMGFGLDALAVSPDGAATATAANGLIATRPSVDRLPYARSAAFVLKNTAAALAGSGHARRAIVYLSDGSTLRPFGCTSADPSCSVEYRDDMLDAFDAARRADVPVYSIDPRGGQMPEDAVRGGISVIHNEATRQQIVENMKIQDDNLATIAVNTGGRAFFHMPDLKRAVDEIVGENGSYYLLGYYPDPFLPDGKFHDLKVHVTRPGMRVRARQGYVAPSSGHAVTTTTAPLDAALSSGVNVSGLPIRVFAAPLAAGAKGVTTALTVEVTYPRPADGSNEIDDVVDVGVVALDPDGKIKAESRHALKFSASAPASGPLAFLIDDVIELPSQPLTLRVAVASRALGTAGTSQMLVDVPKLSGSLEMSGVAVGLEHAPQEPAMNTAPIAPLVPFQPTLARTFAHDDTLRIFGRVFWKGSDQPTVTVTVTGADVSQRDPAPLSSATLENGRREAAFDATLPLKALNLAPGAYQLAVLARLRNGQSASRPILFDVK